MNEVGPFGAASISSVGAVKLTIDPLNITGLSVNLDSVEVGCTTLDNLGNPICDKAMAPCDQVKTCSMTPTSPMPTSTASYTPTRQPSATSVISPTPTCTSTPLSTITTSPTPTLVPSSTSTALPTATSIPSITPTVAIPIFTATAFCLSYSRINS